MKTLSILGASTEPMSLKCTQSFFSEIKNVCSRYKLDYNLLLKSAETNRFNYSKFVDDVKEELDDKYTQIFQVIRQNNIYSPEAIQQNFLNISNSIDAIFTFKNLPRLIYNCKESSPIEFMSSAEITIDNLSGSFMDYFDDIDDFILDIKTKNGYCNFMVRLVKCAYTINCNKGTNLPVMSVAILSMVNSQVITLGQFLVVKGIYPNLLLHPIATQMPCQWEGPCKRLVKLPVEISDGDNHTETEFCYMTKKKLDEYACSISLFNPYVLLNVAAYAWDTYSHRNSLERKNSKRRDFYKQYGVSTMVHDNLGKTHILPVHTYYQYEKEHKEWQGGHHNSPVPHDRRAHKRILRNKDGSIKKIVEVSASRVNSNKESNAYYEIKE